ncbi:hypothetical protein [Chengkuizengella axinellae]|uniref:Uncharacterized protein n=1 Tax=Chengkuizengella axinellae TaxID=3064388 RepID=A0ABT9IYN0_9BACL|nr:hypothetical protein [Chengkuizengella sp. 2205SS18-9]MDP5274462.1 hypothetical protein [Chengkuizengella sp. 2205SS18-9]
MGVFDESKCNCCVCPMQCVLEQLVGNQIVIATTSGSGGVTLFNVDNFIAFTSEGDFPICNISAVDLLDVNINIKLKPIRNNKGRCSCCEDPITNLAKTLIRQQVGIEFIPTFGAGTIVNVGEGIIDFKSFVVSSCFTTRIIPNNQQQTFEASSGSIFGRPLHKITPPLIN